MEHIWTLWRGQYHGIWLYRVVPISTQRQRYSALCVHLPLQHLLMGPYMTSYGVIYRPCGEHPYGGMVPLHPLIEDVVGRYPHMVCYCMATYVTRLLLFSVSGWVVGHDDVLSSVAPVWSTYGVLHCRGTQPCIPVYRVWRSTYGVWSTSVTSATHRHM